MAIFLLCSTACRSENASASRTEGNTQVNSQDEINPSPTRKTIGLTELCENYFSIVTDEQPLNITHDLNLPKEIDGIKAEWKFSDESLIEPSGKVHRPHYESQYLTLTAKFSDSKETRIEQKSLRVARDMYAGLDPEKFPLVSTRFDDDVQKEEKSSWKGTEGPWYIIDSSDRIGAFSSTPEDRAILRNLESDGLWSRAMMDGRLSIPRIDTAEEAYLLLRTLERATYCQRSMKDLVLRDIRKTEHTLTYYFTQYYHGIHVEKSTATVARSFHYDNYSSISLYLMAVPDDLDITPSFSQEEAMKMHELDSAELVIYEKNHVVQLAYSGYKSNYSRLVYVDAHTGKVLDSFSTVMTTELTTSEETTSSEETTTSESTDPSSDPGKQTVYVEDDEEPILKRCLVTGGEDEIPLEGYVSGPDPVWFISGYYASAGVTTSKMQDVRGKLLSVITDESSQNITHDLNLPDEIDGVSVTWEFSDPSLIEPSGKVHRPHDRSQYLVMTTTLTEKGTVKLRHVLRVARDMYDTTDPEKLPMLTYIDDPAMYEDLYESWMGTEGGWYIFDEMDLIVFFDPDPENNVSVYNRSREGWKSYLLGGQLSEPRVDTAHEAYLNIVTLGQILDITKEIKELQFNGTDFSIGEVCYDFEQYYQGVPVLEGMVRVLSCVDRPYVTLNVHLLPISGDFDVTPKLTAEEVMEQNDMRNANLYIWQKDGKPHLVYIGFRKTANERVYVDAKTGEVLLSASTVIVD